MLRLPGFGRLERAIVRELRGPLVLGFASFSTVLLLNFLFLLIRQTIEKRLPVRVIVGFAGAELPRIFMFSLPMGMLLAVLVGVGRLSAQSELVALRSAGVSPARIFRPVLLAGGVLAVVGLLCSHVLMPLGRREERALVREIVLAQDVNREIDPGVFYDRLTGAVLYARRAVESEQGRVFEGIVVHRDSPDGRSADLLLARRGRAFFDAQTGRRTLLLDEGEWHILRPQTPDSYNIIHFEHYTLPFPPDPAFAGLGTQQSDDPQLLVGFALRDRLRELRQERDRQDNPGAVSAAAARLRYAALDWHRRWAMPAATVILAFAAFPLAARTRRGGRFSGLSQALAIIFLFWLLLSIGWGLAEQGKWPPWLGPWAPNIATGLWAIWLWIQLGRTERGLRPLDLLRERLAAPFRRLRRRGSAPSLTLSSATQKSGPVAECGRRRGLPSRLDSYIISGYIKMFFAVLFVLSVLAVAVGFKGVIDQVDPLSTKFPWADIATYLALSTPTQLRFVLPISALFGAAVSLSILSRNNEVVALKAAGIGPIRLTLPLFAVTLVVAFVYGAVQETFLPAAERESLHALNRVRGRTVGAELLVTGRRWLVGDPQRLWSYLDWETRTETILNPSVIVADLDAARVVERIEAERAHKTASGWRFTNGWRRTFDSQTPPGFERFGQSEAPFGENTDLFGATRRRFVLGRALPDQMTAADLWRHLQRMARSGYDPAPLVVGFHEKLVMPLLPLCLVIFGAPLTVSGWQRRASLFGFGVALLIVLGYWSSWAVTTSLGRAGVLNPVIAVWAPPAALALFGLWRLSRAR